MKRSAKTVFDQAQPVETVKVSAARKKSKVKIAIGKSLDALATINYAMKQLSELKANFDAVVKTAAFQEMISLGMEQGKAPESFIGFGEFTNHDKEPISTATVTLKKRSELTPLTQDELVALRKHRISVQDYIIEPPVEEHYIINPEYCQDQNLLRKVDKALKKVADLPDDFIQLVPESPGQVVQVTTPDSLGQIFEIDDQQICEQLVQICGSLSLLNKSECADLRQAFQILRNLKLMQGVTP